jgi:hypothetical protein
MVDLPSGQLAAKVSALGLLSLTGGLIYDQSIFVI